MAWGRIDDGFDDHPKVVALLDEDDPTDAAVAIGLWTLCFTWAHRNTRRRGQTPGLLPAGLPRRFFGAIAKNGAQLLVKHRLWDAQDDGGWLIHDFGDYLPTEETRSARSEAGKRGAAARWAEKHAAKAVEAEAMANSHADDDNLPLPCDDAASNGLANDGSRAPAHREPIPTPTPVPESTSVASLPQRAAAEPQPKRERATRLPMTFEVTSEMREWAAIKAPGVDIDRETEKFCNHWRAKGGKDATKVSWVLTWNNWMLTAAERLPINGRASPNSRTSGSTRHIDEISHEERNRKNPFTSAPRASQIAGASP